METKHSSSGQTDPINKKEEVPKSKDKHIDQDFEGYPHHPAKEKVIHPESEDDFKVAGSGDEEEFANTKPEKKEDKNKTEVLHTGSGGAFEATEEVDHDSELSDEERENKNKIY